jgi:ADP-ribosylation factor-like protein 8
MRDSFKQYTIFKHIVIIIINRKVTKQRNRMGALLAKLTELFSSRKLELCLVGLENSGKTTLLNVLANGQVVETLPTVGLNVKLMKKEGVKMKVWDLGGQERFRKEWPKYTSNSDVVLFVVDSSDRERIPLAKKELHNLLEDNNLAGTPILILLNKIDVEPRFTKTEIISLLNLDYIDAKRNPWAVVPISALKQTNISEVLDWLLENSK